MPIFYDDDKDSIEITLEREEILITISEGYDICSVRLSTKQATKVVRVLQGFLNLPLVPVTDVELQELSALLGLPDNLELVVKEKD